MKIRKKLLKILSLFTCFIMVALLSCESVNAFYLDEENKLTGYTVDRNNNRLTINIQYQKGISDIEVYICEHHTNCNKDVYKTKYTPASDYNMVINPNNEVANYSHTFTTQTEGDPLNEYIDPVVDGKADSTYQIYVRARFCIMRKSDNSGCYTWEEEQKDLVLETFTLKAGLTTDGEINDVLYEVLYITNQIVIPILWLGLGVLLIVRGIMLGIGIVKSADEPEVRKKKVNGLIWLAIGVFLGYVVTIGASAIMGMLGYGGYF